MIGSSSGGYLASILGCLLNAEYVIAFSAQFELRNRWAKDVNPFLQKYEVDNERAQYYDLKKLLLQNSTPIYYIVPIRSDQDSYNYEYIKDVPCIHPMIFNSKHHGVVKDHSGVRYSKEDIKRRKVERKFDKRSIKKNWRLQTPVKKQ